MSWFTRITQTICKSKNKWMQRRKFSSIDGVFIVQRQKNNLHLLKSILDRPWFMLN